VLGGAVRHLINEHMEGGSTLLNRAITVEAVIIVEELIAGKVDLNKTSRLGLTALHVAVNSGRSEMVKLLLDVGARVDIKYQDKTAYDLIPEFTTLSKKDAIKKLFESKMPVATPAPKETKEPEKIEKPNEPEQPKVSISIPLVGFHDNETATKLMEQFIKFKVPFEYNGEQISIITKK